MDATNTGLTANDIESLRQAAADRGDCETSALCNQALWGNTPQKRSGAVRKLKRMIAAEAV